MNQSQTTYDIHDEIARAVADPSVIRAVETLLSPAGHSNDVDDVLSTAAERALRTASSYDPERGTVRVWVKVMARSAALDHLKAKSREHKLTDAVRESACSTTTSLYAVSQDDETQEVVDRLAGQEQAREVLALVARLCSNPQSWSRVVCLIVEGAGDLDATASMLGIGIEALKDSRREVARIARVVDRALRLNRDGAPATMRAVLRCLPDGTSLDRHWSQVVALAAIDAGGFEHVSAEDIVERTSFSMNTARQYLAETKRLLQIAYTVISRGREVLQQVGVDVPEVDGS